MNTPRVSIIIPVFNAESYLALTLENVLCQTWANKEIIVIDNGSTDNSLAVARSFENKGVQIIRTANHGAAAARNEGFRRSSGDYIQYLDADDLMDVQKIDVQMKRFLSVDNPAQVVCSGRWQRFGRDIHDLIGGIGPGGQAECDLPAADWLLLRPYNLMLVHDWLTPRQLIERAGGWNETMTLDDDGEFFIRVVGGASAVLFCENAMVYYRTNLNGTGGISKFSGFDKSDENCVKLKSAYQSLGTYKKVLQRLGPPGMQNAIARNYLYLAFDSYLICDEVYEASVNQPEVPAIQRFFIYRYIGGKFGLLILMVGWRTAKRIMVRLRSYGS